MRQSSVTTRGELGALHTPSPHARAPRGHFKSSRCAISHVGAQRVFLSSGTVISALRVTAIRPRGQEASSSAGWLPVSTASSLLAALPCRSL